jgi:hypothetical protein
MKKLKNKVVSPEKRVGITKAAVTKRIPKHIKKEMLIKALKDCNGLLSFACAKCNFSTSVYYKFLHEDPDFVKQINEIQEAMIDIVENQLYKNIAKGDNVSTIFYLKTKARHRGYAEKVENFHTIESIVIKPAQIEGGEIKKLDEGKDDNK